MLSLSVVCLPTYPTRLLLHRTDHSLLRGPTRTRHQGSRRPAQACGRWPPLLSTYHGSSVDHLSSWRPEAGYFRSQQSNRRQLFLLWPPMVLFFQPPMHIRTAVGGLNSFLRAYPSTVGCDGRRSWFLIDVSSTHRDLFNHCSGSCTIGLV